MRTCCLATCTLLLSACSSELPTDPNPGDGYGEAPAAVAEDFVIEGSLLKDDGSIEQDVQISPDDTLVYGIPIHSGIRRDGTMNAEIGESEFVNVTTPIGTASQRVRYQIADDARAIYDFYREAATTAGFTTDVSGEMSYTPPEGDRQGGFILEGDDGRSIKAEIRYSHEDLETGSPVTNVNLLIIRPS